MHIKAKHRYSGGHGTSMLLHLYRDSQDWTNIWINYSSKHSEIILTNLEMSTKCDILTGNAC